MTKKALGKGLGAFIPDEFSILKEERYAEVGVEEIRPNPDQPRVKFDEKTIEELAASIQESGVVQPVLVVPEGWGARENGRSGQNRKGVTRYYCCGADR